jgi:hypothetical protein
VKNLAQSIPAKWRTAVYSILGTLVGLEAIFDVVEDGLEGKILSALVVLGFGTAVLNVGDQLPPPPPPGDGGVAPNFVDEFP